MGILDRFRRGNSDENVRLLRFNDDEYDPFDAFDSSALPYASEFELPREEARLRAVYEHERRGGNFVVRKQYSNKGRTSREIATLDKFPVFDELLQAVEEQYGGGTYNVCPANSQKVLKSYVVDGPPKSGNQKEGTTGGRGISGLSVKQRLEGQAERELDGLLQNDPELGRTLASALLKKQFGVDLPGASSYEDRLFQAELENNPEYRQQYLEAALKNKGVRPKKDIEVDEFDRIIGALEKAQKLKDAMGADSGDGNSWRGIVQDAIKAGAEYFKGGGRLPIPTGGMTPAISQQQAIGPVAEDVQAPPRPIEPLPVPPQPPERGRVMGMSQSDLTPEEPARFEEREKLPAVDLAEIDWMALLPQVDWGELEAQANGDPGDFMQTVYTKYYENDSEPHGILRDLFLNNTPQAIIGAFVDAGQMLSKPWVMGMARMVGKTADIECAGRIIDRLTGTPECQHWIAEAAAAARIIEQRLLEVESGGEVPQPESEDPEYETVDSGQFDDENNQMLMHPGLHNVLEGGDDDSDNFDVVR